MENNLTGPEFTRLANNFYNANNTPTDLNRIAIDSHLGNYINENSKKAKSKFKVAMVFICLNPLYWEYAKLMVEGARSMFLPGHETDFLFWTDIPEDSKEVVDRVTQAFLERGVLLQDPTVAQNFNNMVNGIVNLRSQKDINIYPTESVAWPFPTLMRYNLFLQQEEKLKEYDYIFYCDIDMAFVNFVGDEILGEGLTIAPHPGYYVRRQLWPPYEPNSQSASFIQRPGRVGMIDGQKRFIPYYTAGGFQGGKTDKFIAAMKVMKDLIDKDLANNYIPIWNDESTWNKYIFDIQTKEDLEKTIFLTPSYIYPDSLIKEYYEPIVWGQSYTPRLVTLTKWFSLSKEGGQAITNMLNPK